MRVERAVRREAAGILGAISGTFYALANGYIALILCICAVQQRTEPRPFSEAAASIVRRFTGNLDEAFTREYVTASMRFALCLIVVIEDPAKLCTALAVVRCAPP